MKTKRTNKHFRLAALLLLLAFSGLSIHASRNSSIFSSQSPEIKKQSRLNTGFKNGNPKAGASAKLSEPFQSGGTIEITRSVISGGGELSTGGTTKITGSIGQPSIETSNGGNFSLSSGFWNSVHQNQCPAITVNPQNLPDGQIGQPYSQQLTQTGATGTITWSISEGSLPGNVALNFSTGLISGTPTASGTFNFTVKAMDNNGCTGTRPYALAIQPCPVISILPGTLPSGTVGIAYNQMLTVNGGTPPYSFSLNAGSPQLPTGLTLSASGLISGMPASEGTTDITVKVVDANGCAGTQAYSLTITPPVVGNGLMFYPLDRPFRLLDTRPANERPGPAFDTPGTKLIGVINAGTPRTQQALVTFDGQTIPSTARAIVGT
ncbi:MAG: Ig domain-containing protein, partial [Blastocatellales bacterium]